MSHTLRDGLREAWRDREIQIWIASTFLHVLLLIAASQIAVPPPPPDTQAALETRLLKMPEPPPIEETEPIELPPGENPSPVQDEAIAEIPADPPTSVEAVNPDNVDAAPLSPVDNPSSDAITAMLESDNPATLASKGLGGILNSRGKGNKLGLLAAQGGSKETEDAVRWGLEWLVRHQYPDGHWSTDHTPLAKGPTTGTGRVRSMMGATAMATLPFLAAGYTHREGPYRRVVQGSLRWMIEHQQPSGLLLASGDGSVFYSHGLATIAMCEAYALTKDGYLQSPCKAAIKFLLDTQNQAGGWRYNIGDGQCDTSVLGWQVMALKSAVLAGIDVPPEAFEKCKGFLESVRTGPNKELFGYIVNRQNVDIPVPASTTSIGQLCMQFMGTPQNDPVIDRSVDYFLERTPNSQTRDCYYWYYATQVIHNVQGPKWDRWNRAMKRELTRSQNVNSESTDHGSWDPERPSRDRWAADAGGRHMLTCFNVLCLEVYYRYLPLYSITESADGGKEPRKEERPRRTREVDKKADQEGDTDAPAAG